MNTIYQAVLTLPNGFQKTIPVSDSPYCKIHVHTEMDKMISVFDEPEYRTEGFETWTFVRHGKPISYVIGPQKIVVFDYRYQM